MQFGRKPSKNNVCVRKIDVTSGLCRDAEPNGGDFGMPIDG